MSESAAPQEMVQVWQQVPAEAVPDEQPMANRTAVAIKARAVYRVEDSGTWVLPYTWKNCAV